MWYAISVYMGVEWLSDYCFSRQMIFFFSIFHCEKKQDYIRADDDDVRFVLAQHT